MYDMKTDKKMEKAGKERDGVSMAKTAKMEGGEHTSGGNESYVLGAAGKVGLYLKDMGRGKGY